MSIGQSLLKMSDRIYDRMRDPQALLTAKAGPLGADTAHLEVTSHVA